MQKLCSFNSIHKISGNIRDCIGIRFLAKKLDYFTLLEDVVGSEEHPSPLSKSKGAMSLLIRWNHPYQFLKLAYFKVVHMRTDKKLVQEKPYDTI